MSTSRQQLTSPSKLRPGDYVKLRLWLSEEDSCILIEMAEIESDKDHWIKAEFITVHPNDWAQIEPFLALQARLKRHLTAMSDHILIRAQQVVKKFCSKRAQKNRR